MSRSDSLGSPPATNAWASTTDRVPVARAARSRRTRCMAVGERGLVGAGGQRPGLGQRERVEVGQAVDRDRPVLVVEQRRACRPSPASVRMKTPAASISRELNPSRWAESWLPLVSTTCARERGQPHQGLVGQPRRRRPAGARGRRRRRRPRRGRPARTRRPRAGGRRTPPGARASPRGGTTGPGASRRCGGCARDDGRSRRRHNPGAHAREIESRVAESALSRTLSRTTRPAESQATSNRSLSMTLAHAFTKSRTNFSCGVVAGVDLGEGAQLRVGPEDQVDRSGRPPHVTGREVADLVDVLGRLRDLPLGAAGEQVDEEVVGQCVRCGR